MCDAGPPPELLWMPAHTKAADVGTARLSDGSLLSCRDRAANDAADHLAKRAAESHRVPKNVRKTVQLRERLAVWAAKTLAVATFAANNAADADGKTTLRDSAGLSRAARRKAAAAARAVAASQAASSVPASPDDDGRAQNEPPRPPESASASPSGGASRECPESPPSSDDNLPILERMGNMPSAAQRQKAHVARAEAQSQKAAQRTVQSTARRTLPARASLDCPAKAQVVKTLAATAAAARPAVLASPPRASGHEPARGRPPLQQGGPPRLTARPARTRHSSLAAERSATTAAVASLLSAPRG